MLRLLRIRDFALIRELEIEFREGLNLLTGETGSGKSILVDALGLILGGRSSQEMVRSNCETAVLEGMFAFEDASDIPALLEVAGIDPGEHSVLIRREISLTGRNRIFINNSLATLGLLRSLGDRLADIHGQQDRLSLLELSTHLDWLDRFGGNAAEVAKVSELFRSMRDIAARLDSMQMDEQERLRRVDMLQFQMDEIKRANPQPQEREALESERNILMHREKIFALSAEAYAVLYESDTSIVGQAKRLSRILQELESFDASWAPHRESLGEMLYKLEDLSFTARDYTSALDFSPGRLDQVEQRLSDLERLLHKYGASIEEVLAHARRCQEELDALQSYSDTSRNISDELAAALEHYLERAGSLSQKRHDDARGLERSLRKEFQALAMEKMELSVRFHRSTDEAAAGRIPARCGPTGTDHVEFLIAPNRGEELRPLTRTASGGELSRVMLAIRSLCGTGDQEKTLVFDEVDAGIGGRVAEAVGRRLRDIARTNQVLCVTHLPQIAAFGSRHFYIRKEAVRDRTETFVHCLDEQERVQELARMLGGEVVTDTARDHARELLAQSHHPPGKKTKEKRG
jgi:DNA repair protein RecN (Recombination protein N)